MSPSGHDFKNPGNRVFATRPREGGEERWLAPQLCAVLTAPAEMRAELRYVGGAAAGPGLPAVFALDPAVQPVVEVGREGVALYCPAARPVRCHLA